MHRASLFLLIPAMLLVLLTQSDTLAAEARGTVIAVNGREATIRLSRIPHDTAPAVGDLVELTYTIGEDTIPVGTWRVSEVTDAATVVAAAVEAAVPPQLNMDAVVHVSGTQQTQPESPPVHTGTQTGNRVIEPPSTTAEHTATHDVAKRHTQKQDGMIDPIDLDLMNELFSENVTQGTSQKTQPASKGQPESEPDDFDMEANVELAKDYFHGRNGKPQDKARAFKLIHRGCDKGFMDNCVTVAWMYYHGHGVEQNLRQAALYYRNSCEGGEYEACTDIGNMYRKGKGVAKDLQQARVYLNRGCRNGVGKSCNKLGVMAAKGEGIAQDHAMAVSLFRQGCDAGHALSCSNLGVKYAAGEGIERDLVKAASLYKQGCDGGEATPCGKLGLAYSRGEGVEKNLQKAIPLLEKGCAKGDDVYCNRLEEIR